MEMAANAVGVGATAARTSTTTADPPSVQKGNTNSCVLWGGTRLEWDAHVCLLTNRMYSWAALSRITLTYSVRTPGRVQKQI